MRARVAPSPAPLPTGDKLQRLLDTAATEFINNRQNVRVDHEARAVVLSTIFKWYKGDFVNHMAALGRPAERGLLDYLETVADEPLLNDLQRASDYSIEFRDYDWRLNGME